MTQPTGAPGQVEPGAIEFFETEDDTIKRGYTRQEAYEFLTRRRLFSESLTAADTPEHTGAMIALVPTDADAQRIAVVGGEPIEQLHVTLFYLGEAALISEEQRLALTQAVTRVSSGCCPVVAEAFGVAAFNPMGEEPCAVLNIGGDPIEDYRELIEDALDEVALATPEQHEPYVAHLTLQYDPDFENFSEFFTRLGPITFDRVRLAFGGDFVDIPLMSEMTSSAYDLAGTTNEGGDMPYHVAKNAECGAEKPSATSESFAAEEDMPENNMPEADASVPEEMSPDGTAWEGILVIEGIETGDGRQFSLGAITWADLPIPLKWQPSQGEGHDGSVVVGRIDEIWRDEENPAIVRGKGVFDDAGVNGAEALRLVSGGFLRGVSVDPDNIKDSDVELIFPETPEKPTDGEDGGEGEGEGEGDILLAPITMPELTIFHAGRLRGATLVDIPAFAECMLWLTNQPAVTASMDSEFRPDSRMFQNPGLTAPTPMTITEDGHIFGHGAAWNSCHTGFADVCVMAPREGEHSYYRLGEVLCSDGSRVAVGTITMGTGHAPTAGISAKAAAEHYDNTGTVVAYVASGEDAHGIWFSGVVKPGIPQARVEELRGATLSGDWRRIGGSLRLVAFLAVNRPGFPIPRLSTYVSKQRQYALVAAGVVSAAQQPHKSAAVASAIERIAKTVGRDAASRITEMHSRMRGKK